MLHAVERGFHPFPDDCNERDERSGYGPSCSKGRVTRCAEQIRSLLQYVDWGGKHDARIHGQSPGSPLRWGR